MKKILFVLFCLSAIVLPASAFVDGEDRTEETSSETSTVSTEALGVLHDLYLLPEPEKATKPQAKMMKRVAAELVIDRYALQKKLGFSEKGEIEGRIFVEDQEKALQDLSKVLPIFADQEFGDKNGETIKEEVEKMKKGTEEKEGFIVLLSMFKSFGISSVLDENCEKEEEE